ncbi:MAG: hypothetical protein IPI12_02445 [Ignavibacteriales bacterium]|jgi:hypothetical protein|nr:hypothetical protein [Ignavibacteriales bacterium]MBK7265201.1 hypothetical protein [Ignavibacteriales bacterium]MBK8661704.1 hypothetical protein [Ignavibacteriales bacterium]MBP9121882.1 hypothetical protein [Ignavibacteriaceae bacterium]MCC6636814.1 hypothetical protein [Ignavibacteriaceae bacterium]
MVNHNVYNWSVKSGDFKGHTGDYDKLYKKGKKRDKLVNTLLWIGAGFLTYIVFFKVLAYAAAR